MFVLDLPDLPYLTSQDYQFAFSIKVSNQKCNTTKFTKLKWNVKNYSNIINSIINEKFIQLNLKLHCLTLFGAVYEASIMLSRAFWIIFNSRRIYSNIYISTKMENKTKIFQRSTIKFCHWLLSRHEMFI